VSLKINALRNNLHHIDTLLIPAFFFYITTRFKILNPKVDGWLSDGDGTYEIAWEFYRNTPFPMWLMGNVDSYGSDMARPSFYVLPSLFAWPMRFFSGFLGERFQFIGFMILLNLILHFYISKKIFLRLKFSELQSLLSSTALLTAPLVHYRYLDLTHYTLTSNWVILFLIYLVLNKDLNWYKWSFLIISSLLIFPYYFFMVVVTTYLFFLYQAFIGEFTIKDLLKNIAGGLGATFFSAVISGYLLFGNTLERDADLIWSANLNTLIDPSGWSRILGDRPESTGNYEGFAFLGLNFIFLIIFAIVLVFIKKLKSKKIVIDKFSPYFFIVFIAAFFLYLISLSRSIYFDDTKLFEINENWISRIIELNFRSPGRFVWVLVYFIMIYTLYNLQKNLTKNLFIGALILATLLGFWDTWPKLTSQTNARFSLNYENPLSSKFWSKLGNCYNTIVSVPSVTTAELLYPIAKIAYSQQMSIYPASIPRVPPTENFFMQVDTSQQIRYGSLKKDKIYIFQKAQYIIDTIVEQDKNIALNTMPKGARAGVIDDIFVVAPDFENCDTLYSNYSQLLNISKQYFYGVDESIVFANNTEASNHLISGWSDIEQDGVWTVQDTSGLLVQNLSEKPVSAIKIAGERFNFPDNTSPEMRILINGKEKLKLDSYLLQKTFVIYLEDDEVQQDTFYIEFRFNDLKSPREVTNSEDDRLLGFKLKSLSFIEKG
jgi:hypothetical protein